MRETDNSCTDTQFQEACRRRASVTGAEKMTAALRGVLVIMAGLAVMSWSLGVGL